MPMIFRRALVAIVRQMIERLALFVPVVPCDGMIGRARTLLIMSSSLQQGLSPEKRLFNSI
jgi:hypothetical protein